MAELEKQIKNYRLTTAKILYHMPDYETLLQEYVWQEYDLAPRFPELSKFLEFWERKIEGKLHSVYIANKEIITPGDYRFAEWQGTLQ
ncbi:MAG: Usg family protein [Micavibrio sp. TMED27]|nr:Usg family protein [Micavibrio sp.]OUT90595.1 MAG: Usg family protein [Micavibrio sp. TMED27]|tara:strand:+ start:362 stop:625 length:264 start_codon:yes stop_codon:yes gene_type:complete